MGGYTIRDDEGYDHIYDIPDGVADVLERFIRMKSGVIEGWRFKMLEHQSLAVAFRHEMVRIVGKPQWNFTEHRLKYSPYVEKWEITPYGIVALNKKRLKQWR